MPERGHAHVAEPLPVAHQRFRAEQLHVGIVDEQAHHTVGRRSGRACGRHRVAPDEPTGLVPRDGEPETGLEHRVGGVDVDAHVIFFQVTDMAIATFHLKILPENPFNGFGFCGRLHDQ